MRFTVETIGIWLSQFDAWLAIALAILFLVLAVAVGVVPVKMIKHFSDMDQRLCRDNSVKSPIGDWPAWISFVATLWVAVPGAFAVFRKHLQTQDVWKSSIFHAIGFDFSDPVPHSFLFGLCEMSIPSDFALYLDRFEKLWYVPILAVAVVFLLRMSKFRSPQAAIGFIVGELFLTNAIYWLYGGYLMFVLVPIVVTLAVLIFGGGSKGSDVPARQREGNSATAPAREEASSSGTASSSGIGVESQDMFNGELVHTRSLGPDQHLEHDESQDSIYGNTYVDRDSGKEYRVIETDAFGHPTKVEEKWP